MYVFLLVRLMVCVVPSCRPSAVTLTLKVKSRFRTKAIGAATVDVTGLPSHKQVPVDFSVSMD
jgi:hypothetical protein